MDIKILQATIIKALEDVKAQDIALFDTTKLTDLFDRMIIASGSSNRQTKALAASVRDQVKEAGGEVIGLEGETTGEWVLVDLGDIIVHIMQPAIRSYYQLEEIWGEKRIELSAAKRAARSKTASSKKTDEETKAAPVKKTGTRTSKTKVAVSDEVVKKTATKKSVASKTATTKVTKTATTKAAVKPAAKEKVAAKAKPATKAKTGSTKKTSTKPIE